MSQESKVPTRTGAVIAVAAGALTLAAGVTIGSLLGWVGPARTAPADPPAEAAPSDPAPSAPAIGDDETTLAARERPGRERGEHHEGKRRHHHEEREHDD